MQSRETNRPFCKFVCGASFYEGQLASRFSFLTARSATPRQSWLKRLHAVLRHSWDLLSPQTRRGRGAQQAHAAL